MARNSNENENNAAAPLYSLASLGGSHAERLTTNAALNLEAESGIKSYSIDMLRRRLATGDIVLEEGAVLVVDEATQGATVQMAELVGFVEKVNGRDVIAGDPPQLQAVGAGGIFNSMIEEAGDAAVFLDETRRQKDDNEKAVLALLHDAALRSTEINRNGLLRANTRKALAKMEIEPELREAIRNCRGKEEAARIAADWYVANGRVVVHNSSADAEAVVAAEYWDYIEKYTAREGGLSMKEAVLVQAKTNPEAVALNQAIIIEGVHRGVLVADTAFDFGRKTFLHGQRVTALDVQSRYNITNGDVGAVEGVEVVNAAWKGVFKTPKPFEFSRTLRAEANEGDKLLVEFTRDDVARERANALNYVNKTIERIHKVDGRAAKTGTEERVALLRAQLDSGEKWATWAKELPTDGGKVELALESIAVSKIEERLVVRLDDGTTRTLPEEYVRKHVGPGYATTENKGQGSTVQISLPVNTTRYTAASRSVEATIFHLTYIDENAEDVELEIAKLEPTKQWLATRLGAEAAEQTLKSAFEEVAETLAEQAVVLDNGLTMHAEATAQQLSEEVARSVALGHIDAESVVAVVKTRAMAADISDRAVALIVESAKGSIVPALIDNRSWIAGQSVVVRGAGVAGLSAGSTAVIAGVSESKMFIDDANGKRYALTADEVKESIDSGLVITAARAARSDLSEARTVIVVASGLDSDDLTKLSQKGVPIDLMVTDPQVSSDILYQKGAYEHTYNQFLDGMRLDRSSLSATVVRSQVVEKGIESAREEIALSSRRMDEVRDATPRETAKRDLELARVAAREREEDLQVRSADLGLEETDRLDAAQGIQVVEAELTELGRRRDILVSKLPDENPEVSSEIAVSVAFHELDAVRIATAEKHLKRYWQARVTDAIKSPREYHQVLDADIDPDLDPKQAHDARLEKLVRIEEYRMKWGITDELSALGVAPKGGLQAREWASVQQLIYGKSHARHQGHGLSHSL